MKSSLTHGNPPTQLRHEWLGISPAVTSISLITRNKSDLPRFIHDREQTIQQMHNGQQYNPELWEIGITAGEVLIRLTRRVKDTRSILGWTTHCCVELRPVAFGTSEEILQQKECVVKEGDDVGPLGLFVTRDIKVGGGPFLSEALDEFGVKPQDIDREFGVTTGRKRRCGWLDLQVVKYSAAINTYTEINLTKPEVLDTSPKIKVAIAYRDPETKEEIEGFPADSNYLEHVKVEYVTLEGWEKPTGQSKSFYDLPVACREYFEFIEKFVGVMIEHIGIV